MTNNVGLILRKRAWLSPGLEGLVDTGTGKRYTFDELNRRSNRTANFVRELGVKPGDRVALLLMNGVEFIESFFALAKIGVVVVPLNWRLVADELAFILKDSGAGVLIYGGEFAEVAGALQSRGPDATAIAEWIQVGGEGIPGFARSYGALHQSAPETEPGIGAEEEDLLYIMYTSGTTGLPKGAMHTHNSAIWTCISSGPTIDQRYRDRYLMSLPLFHVGALTPLTTCVYCGITAVVLRSFDPVRTWELIESERISIMLAVPSMLNFMLQVPDHASCNYSSLRWIMSGAAPVPVAFIEAYAKIGIEIHQIYGLTECCGPACLTSPEDALRKAGSTGKAFFHTDVRVVDAQGNDTAPDVPGEVIIRCKHLMKGYWNHPEATADTIRDGWLYTGDVATVDDEGFVYIQDRTKDMIISGGENVYPAEIENVILRHPKVKEVAVIGQPSAKWGESPLAIVVRNDDTLTGSEILDHCKGKLAPFKLPKTVQFIDVIPRNPTGKVLKRVLREQYSGPGPE